jgi:hypothetical protein
MTSYIQCCAVAISCLVNAILAGRRYEILSSRSHRCQWTFAVAVLDWIFGRGHCRECYQFELDNFDGIQD